MKISKNAKNAIYIGLLCALSYLPVYISRDLLSAVTPQMVEAGYTESFIGTVSSLYLLSYAVGQLVNGIIGDRVNSKLMIAGGLFGAGLTLFGFMKLLSYPILSVICYTVAGFCLSMIYGPMTKVVSENTEPIHAVRCSLGYTFASFIGSPMAGVLGALLIWNNVFKVGSLVLISMAMVCFGFFTLFERRGIVKYNAYAKKEKGISNVKLLFEHEIVKFSLIAILTGIVRTSVVFWLPTYISQYLEFSPKSASGIFTVCTFIISMSTFVAVFMYEKMGQNMSRSILVTFFASALFFLLTYAIDVPVLNIVFIVLAILASNTAASILWSVYCPSLYETGMVSSATGFLDFLSYGAAALANLIFANAVSKIGWGNLILVWTALMLIGVIICLPYRRKSVESKSASAEQKNTEK